MFQTAKKKITAMKNMKEVLHKEIIKASILFPLNRRCLDIEDNKSFKILRVEN
jgi:hypothetical protein